MKLVKIQELWSLYYQEVNTDCFFVIYDGKNIIVETNPREEKEEYFNFPDLNFGLWIKKNKISEFLDKMIPLLK